jgi:hypothetical protein
MPWSWLQRIAAPADSGGCDGVARRDPAVAEDVGAKAALVDERPQCPGLADLRTVKRGNLVGADYQCTWILSGNCLRFFDCQA